MVQKRVTVFSAGSRSRRAGTTGYGLRISTEEACSLAQRCAPESDVLEPRRNACLLLFLTARRLHHGQKPGSDSHRKACPGVDHPRQIGVCNSWLVVQLVGTASICGTAAVTCLHFGGLLRRRRGAGAKSRHARGYPRTRMRSSGAALTRGGWAGIALAARAELPDGLTAS